MARARRAARGARGCGALTRARVRTSTQAAAAERVRLVHAAVPIFVVDTFGRVVEWSERAECVSGRSSEDLRYVPLIETLVAAESRPGLKNTLDSLIAGRTRVAENAQVLLVCKDGSVVDMLFDMACLHSGSGQVVGVCGVCKPHPPPSPVL